MQAKRSQYSDFELKRVFNSVDEQKIGSIDTMGVLTACAALKIPIGLNEIFQRLPKYDKDKCGRLYFEEFVRFIRAPGFK